MDLRLDGRVFIVTGGSRGLGLATAQVLVAEGASVVVSARDEEVLARAVGTLGERAVALPADLGDPDAAERLAAGAVARFGRLDGTFVSVGGPPPGSPTSTTDDAWRSSFESIFLGAVRITRDCASVMTVDPSVPTGEAGSIVLVLSTSVRQPFTGLTISNGLRPGLAMLVKDFADELGPRGIRVNGLMPGRIATDRMFAIDARLGAPDVVRRRHEADIPLGRYGEPEEFGRAAAFLLSPASSYITGAVIPVDGGVLRAV